MNILLVTWVEAWLRSVSTVHKWCSAGKKLGHNVAVFGEPNPDLPLLPFTTDLKGVDLAIFVTQVSGDLPQMPYLARLLDAIPREQRVVVDLWGRFNDTIQLDHDFNHLEKLDGHVGWEWDDAFRALSGTILQPTLKPLRTEVKPFLFHGYDAASVAKPYESPREAAQAWQNAKPSEKPYGVAYVGNNWQRWHQIREFLEEYTPARNEIGKVCLAGWDWAVRPEWAEKMGITSIDSDPVLLAKLGVEVREAVRFDEVTGLLGKARFAPVLHRPLFRHLNFVTIRTFETFYADTIPVLLLPRDFVQEIYGPAALTLVPAGDVAAHLRDAMQRPEAHWEAVLKTRAHLARHHSFAQRFHELSQLYARRPLLAAVP